MLTNTKLSKAQSSKIIQSGGFLGALLGKLDDPFMKVAVPLHKNVLAPFIAMGSASAIDGTIQKKDTWKRCSNGRKRNHVSHLE